MSSIGSTKLIQLLLTFSKKEFQSFVEVVENPVYNKFKSQIRIAKYLQNNFSEIESIEKNQLEKNCEIKKCLLYLNWLRNI